MNWRQHHPFDHWRASLHGSSKKRLAKRTFLAFLALFPAFTASAQHTLHIPADQPTIQSAIDAALAGDTLVVAPGTYFENLDLHGKAVILRSAEGSAATILDGRRLGPAVSFVHGETRATTLTGFTIRNGAPAGGSSRTHGAGVVIADASPTLTGNLFTDNLCAGLDGTASAPLLQDNRIIRTLPSSLCTAQAVAPVVFTGSSTSSLIPTLIHNVIEANDFSGSLIEPNAGAVALLAAPATLMGNILRLNTVPGDAAAALQILANATPAGSTPILIQQNLIYANTTHCGAGGLAVTILNSAVETSAPHLEVQILNNTIADNVTDTLCATTQASEVELSAGYLAPQILIANNIVATSSAHAAIRCSGPVAATMLHHNLLHSPQSVSCTASSANVDADPAFSGRERADYHLNLSSPAVDAGSNAAGPLPSQDLDSSPRLQNATDQPRAIVDFGAYEHPAPRAISVASSTVLNATISPSEAFQTVSLVVGVTAAQSGTQVLTPTGSITLSAAARNTAPVVLATMPLDANGRAVYTTSSLGSEPWTIVASYGGGGGVEPSTSAPMLQTVHPATAILAFSLTPSTVAPGQTVIASAQVAAPLSTRTPVGAVQFFDLPTGTASAPILLGSGQIDGRGYATLTLPAMTPGTHRILAAYPGAADFTAAALPSSNALVLNVSSADFTESLANVDMTLVAQHHGPVTLTLTSLGTFADMLTLSCGNLPANTTCTFVPATATLTAGSSAKVILTLDTSVIPGFARLDLPATPGRSNSTFALAALFPLGIVSLLGLRRRTGLQIYVMALAVAFAGLTGCGAGKYPDHTAPGTYQINIVAQAKSTGVSHTAALTLTVTN